MERGPAGTELGLTQDGAAEVAACRRAGKAGGSVQPMGRLYACLLLLGWDEWGRVGEVGIDLVERRQETMHGAVWLAGWLEERGVPCSARRVDGRQWTVCA